MKNRAFWNDILDEMNELEFSRGMKWIRRSASWCDKRKEWEEINTEPEYGLWKMYYAQWILWFCVCYLIGSAKQNPALSIAMLALFLYLNGNYQVQGIRF